MATAKQEVPTFAAALDALGVRAGAPAVVLPEGAEAGGTTPVASAKLVLVDAERVELAEALRAARPALSDGALVVVRGKVRGEGVLGGLRGKRELESLVEPLLELPLSAVGTIEVRGMFGVTVVWARLKDDASAWMES